VRATIRDGHFLQVLRENIRREEVDSVSQVKNLFFYLPGPQKFCYDKFRSGGFTTSIALTVVVESLHPIRFDASEMLLDKEV
jgi:hypothetical protein